MLVFHVVMPCGLVNRYCFGETYRLHFQCLEHQHRYSSLCQNVLCCHLKAFYSVIMMYTILLPGEQCWLECDFTTAFLNL